MEKFKLVKDKLNKNKALVLFAGSFLVFSLTNIPSKQNTNTANQEAAIEIKNNYEEKEKTPKIETDLIEKKQLQDEMNDNQNKIIDETSIKEEDKEIDEYVNSLKRDFNELKKYSKDKWQSEEFQSKLNKIKQKYNTLIDFIFNGKEINGITYQDLSEEAKKNVKNSLTELDELINYYIPDYKDKIYEWLVEEGANGLEIWNNIKQDYKEYKQDVINEYNNSSKVILKK